MRKKTLNGIILILLVVISCGALSGFSAKEMTQEEMILYDLLDRRTAVMQRAVFKVYDSEDGVADIEEVYDAFHALAEIETYPLLSEDCNAISLSAGTDFDKVVNLEIMDVKMISKTGNNTFYEADIKWYMSGNTGYYETCCVYKIMTVTAENTAKLARMEVVS